MIRRSTRFLPENGGIGWVRLGLFYMARCVGSGGMGASPMLAMGYAGRRRHRRSARATGTLGIRLLRRPQRTIDARFALIARRLVTPQRGGSVFERLSLRRRARLAPRRLTRDRRVLVITVRRGRVMLFQRLILPPHAEQPVAQRRFVSPHQREAVGAI